MSNVAPIESATMPEISKAQKIADDAFSIAESVVIDSPEMLQIAGEELQSIKKRSNEINEMRLDMTRPLDASKKRIMDFFATPLNRLAQAETLLRNGISVFQKAEREKQRQAQIEAENAARAERERLAKIAAHAEKEAQKAAKKGDEAAALKAAENAEQARQEIELAEVAPIALPDVTQTKVAGISTRTTWKHEIDDFHALVTAAAEGIAKQDYSLAAYLLPNDKDIGAVVRALKSKARIPGVRVYSQDGLSVRT